VISDLSKNNYENWSFCPESLYIHWPFCANRCHYCDFIALEKHNDFIKQYHDALCWQIKHFAKKTLGSPIKTIFMGGGTPSLYPLDLLKELIDILNNSFDLNGLQEFTIESNPADLTKEHLKVYKSLGINRLSVGVQVLDDDVLSKLNRKQKKEDVYRLMEIVPEYFDNVSVDLILGLPGVAESVWNDTINRVVSWPIKHVSIYLLTVYQNTKLYYYVKDKKIKLLDDDKMVDLYQQTVDLLKTQGFAQYEISNFAKQNFESIHNVIYWDRKPYKGFGIGASSFDGEHRFYNEKSLDRYLKNCNKNLCCVEFVQERLDEQQVFIEKLMLGLRQKRGLDLHDMLYFLSGDRKRKFLEGADKLIAQSLLEKSGGRLYLTLKGMMLENEVILGLF